MQVNLWTQALTTKKTYMYMLMSDWNIMSKKREVGHDSLIECSRVIVYTPRPGWSLKAESFLISFMVVVIGSSRRFVKVFSYIFI